MPFWKFFKILSFLKQDFLLTDFRKTAHTSSNSLVSRAPKTTQGFTLIELMIAVFILSVGILSVFLFFSFASISTEFAGDLTVATAHGESLMEEMKAKKTLFDIVNQDWKDWASQKGLDTLTKESFTVAFKDPNANPLEADVTVSWRSKTRLNQITLHGEFVR